ncbi:MAG: hypothetical protein IJ520_00670 [Synergistaceae bacterium]|nr:hypothetical protein [Synergistaceae bacterium]
MAFENLELENLNNLKDERILFSLSRSSSLLDFLRAMYSLVLDYGVYLGDEKDAEPLIFSKEQLVFLIERGHVDLLLKDLPELERDEIIRAININEFAAPDKIQALIIEKRGVSIGTLAGAFNPNQTEYPAWWTAPIAFAMCGRNKVKLNPAALNEFGAELERLNAAALPEKDEFIVELEGKDRPMFLSFRRLAAGIFTIEDCTGDLVEAQDISWWAGLGRLWMNLIEAGGHKWRRLEDASDLKNLDLNLDLDNIDLNNADDLERIEALSGAQILPCEWQDRFMGYLCIEPESALNNNDAVNKAAESEIKAENKIIEDKIEVEDAEANIDVEAAQPDADINLENVDVEVNDENKNENKELAQAHEVIDDIDNEVLDDESGGSEENDILKAISPQTMGLLAPGLNNYNYYDNLYENERELAKAPVKRRLKGDFRA